MKVYQIRIQYWLLFFISPLLSTFLVLKGYRYSFAKNVLWAFILFYGFTFAIGNESESSDIIRYVAQLKILHQESFTIHQAIKYYNDSREVDVLRIFLAITISRLTDSQVILTGVYALIFGFFFSRNLFFVLDRLNGSLTKASLLLLVCFILVVPIWNINGFRMYTAMHMFLYGLLPYLFFEKKKNLWLCGLTIFVHFSFLFPVAVLVLYIVAGNRLWLFFFFFIVTIFVSEIDIGTFNKNFEAYLPQAFVERSENYRLEDKILSFREGTGGNKVWYARWYGKALNYVLIGFLIMLFLIARNKIQKNKGLINLYSFTLLFFAFANLMNTLPSGGRFLSLAALCSLALLIVYIQNIDYQREISKWIPFTTPLLLLFIVVSVRIGFYSISLTTIFGNPIIALITVGEYVALNDIIK